MALRFFSVLCVVLLFGSARCVVRFLGSVRCVVRLRSLPASTWPTMTSSTLDVVRRPEERAPAAMESSPAAVAVRGTGRAVKRRGKRAGSARAPGRKMQASLARRRARGRRRGSGHGSGGAWSGACRPGGEQARRIQVLAVGCVLTVCVAHVFLGRGALTAAVVALALSVAAAYYGTQLLARLLDPVSKQRSAALEKAKRLKNHRVRAPFAGDAAGCRQSANRGAGQQPRGRASAVCRADRARGRDCVRGAIPGGHCRGLQGCVSGGAHGATPPGAG